jgi:hypothetical protein
LGVGDGTVTTPEQGCATSTIIYICNTLQRTTTSGRQATCLGVADSVGTRFAALRFGTRATRADLRASGKNEPFGTGAAAW